MAIRTGLVASLRDDEATVLCKMAARLEHYEAVGEQPRPTAERMCSTCPFRGADSLYREEAAMIPAQDWPCHDDETERCRGHWLAQERFGAATVEMILSRAHSIEATEADQPPCNRQVGRLG
jgi:hypothetical protein